MVMKFDSSILLKILFLQCLSVVLCAGQTDFDFYYLVQQWPGSFCDTKKSCCYPTTGKPPADFGIHGLWPNKNDGSYPSNCDPTKQYDESQISDLISKMQEEWPTLGCPSGSGSEFWEHEWEKHGTCSPLDEHSYFKTTLGLKDKVNLLQALASSGMRPGGSYSLNEIKESIGKAVGFSPWIECNTDTEGNSQLYQVYLCVDSSASSFIECPTFPRGKCGSSVQFPTF